MRIGLKYNFWLFCLVSVFLNACSAKDDIINEPVKDAAFRITKNINYNGIAINVVIDKPQGNEFDVLLLFHGTVSATGNQDQLILQAANNTLNVFKDLLNNKNKLLVSVAYPQANILFGDNLVQAEAALLWVKHQMFEEFGIKANKIFMAGHSQGGYVVTRLNTMYQTNGVIANAPGPLNLVYRCMLEENGQVNASQVCTILKNNYGSTSQNAEAYFERSLLNFTNGFKSDILFVQGLDDSFIQMYSWPLFKDNLQNCPNCQEIEFLDLGGLGHQALFNSVVARLKFNEFINSRL